MQLRIPLSASPSVVLFDKNLELQSHKQNASRWFEAYQNNPSTTRLLKQQAVNMENWAPLRTARVVVCFFITWFGQENCEDGHWESDSQEGLQPCNKLFGTCECIPLQEYDMVRMAANLWTQACNHNGLCVVMPQFNAGDIFAWVHQYAATNQNTLLYIIIPTAHKRNRMKLARAGMGKLMSMWNKDVLKNMLNPMTLYNRLELWGEEGDQATFGQNWDAERATCNNGSFVHITSGIAANAAVSHRVPNSEDSEIDNDDEQEALPYMMQKIPGMGGRDKALQEGQTNSIEEHA